jgi:hypothetical protein
VSAERDKAANALGAGVNPTSACIELERLEGALTDAERAHVNSCPRCQTELALLNRFLSSTPAQDEGAAVQWIVSEVRRRRATGLDDRRDVRAVNGLFGRLGWRSLGLAAAALLVVIVGYVANDREPPLRDEPSSTVGYRTEQLMVISPVGDVAVAPSELTWAAVPGAARYDVEVLQVDRTRLWQGSSSAPRVALPASVIAQFVPGKGVIWEVTAVNASGVSIAVSGAQRFRVAP